MGSSLSKSRPVTSPHRNWTISIVIHSTSASVGIYASADIHDFVDIQGSVGIHASADIYDFVDIRGSVDIQG